MTTAIKIMKKNHIAIIIIIIVAAHKIVIWLFLIKQCFTHEITGKGQTKALLHLQSCSEILEWPQVF